MPRTTLPNRTVPSHRTTPDPDRLLDVDLVLFDLDGTLYESQAFVGPHLAELQTHLPAGGPDLAGICAQVQAGDHHLRLGDLFHLGERRIVRPAAELPTDRPGLRVASVLDFFEGGPATTPAGLEDGHVAFNAPVTYVGDPWQIASAVSHALGVEATKRREAFVATRLRMNQQTYDLGVPSCLNRLLDRYAEVPQRVLVTNTDEHLGRPTVDRLGVADRFTDAVFDAAKPVGLSVLLEERIAAGVPPERILCVGDNYWNDILPAHQLGAQSVLIDPFGIRGIPDGPLHLRTLDDFDRVLATSGDAPKAVEGNR
jgi:phosphoglycolate phosphatase-like HAD superfamily hydrolase